MKGGFFSFCDETTVVVLGFRPHSVPYFKPKRRHTWLLLDFFCFFAVHSAVLGSSYPVEHDAFTCVHCAPGVFRCRCGRRFVNQRLPGSSDLPALFAHGDVLLDACGRVRRTVHNLGDSLFPKGLRALNVHYGMVPWTKTAIQLWWNSWQHAVDTSVSSAFVVSYKCVVCFKPTVTVVFCHMWVTDYAKRIIVQGNRTEKCSYMQYSSPI